MPFILYSTIEALGYNGERADV